PADGFVGGAPAASDDPGTTISTDPRLGGTDSAARVIPADGSVGGAPAASDDPGTTISTDPRLASDGLSASSQAFRLRGRGDRTIVHDDAAPNLGSDPRIVTGDARKQAGEGFSHGK